MSWQLNIRPAALEDIESAADWYEQRSAGLGTGFVARIRTAISSLALEPDLPRIRHARWKIRWIYPKRFPHRIIYRITDQQVTVLAIMHAAHSDVGWKKRL